MKIYLDLLIVFSTNNISIESCMIKNNQILNG